MPLVLIINGWLTLVGFIGVLMLAIGNIVLLPAPMPTAVHDSPSRKPGRPVPTWRERVQARVKADDSPHAIIAKKREVMEQQRNRYVCGTTNYGPLVIVLLLSAFLLPLLSGPYVLGA